MKRQRTTYRSNQHNEPSTSSSPNIWNMATMGGTIGRGGRNGNELAPSTMIISPEDRESIWSFYRNFTVVSGAVHQFISEIMRGSFQITVQLPGRTIEFSPEEKENVRYYTEVLLPGVKQIIFEWILFGYSRVRILPPSRKQDSESEFPTFVVMREGITNEAIVWKNDARKYKMAYASTFQGSGAGKKVPDGHLLIMDAPFDDGGLNSRVARVFGPLRQLKQIWHNYIDAMYYNAHPPYVVTPEPDKNRRSAEEEFRMVESAESAIEGSEDGHKKIRMRVLTEQAEEDRMRSIHSNPGSANSSSLYRMNGLVMPRGNPSFVQEDEGMPSSSSASSVMIEEPWRHGITLPRGQKLNGIPVSKFPDQFLPTIEHLLHQVVRSIGIPPGMLEGGIGQKHAASVEMGNKELATNITLFHQQAEVLLRYFFQLLFRKTIDSSIMERAIEEGQEKNPQYLRSQIESVKVDVKFRYHPIITLESLIELHTQGIITSEAKRDVGLLLFGMPEEYGEKNPDEAIAKRQEDMVTADSKGKVVLEKVKQQAKPNVPKKRKRE